MSGTFYFQSRTHFCNCWSHSFSLFFCYCICIVGERRVNFRLLKKLRLFLRMFRMSVKWKVGGALVIIVCWRRTSHLMCRETRRSGGPLNLVKQVIALVNVYLMQRGNSESCSLCYLRFFSFIDSHCSSLQNASFPPPFLFPFFRFSQLQENGKGNVDVSSTPVGTKKVCSHWFILQNSSFQFLLVGMITQSLV